MYNQNSFVQQLYKRIDINHMYKLNYIVKYLLFTYYSASNGA